jgi:hypothetical protein
MNNKNLLITGIIVLFFVIILILYSALNSGVFAGKFGNGAFIGFELETWHLAVIGLSMFLMIVFIVRIFKLIRRPVQN